MRKTVDLTEEQIKAVEDFQKKNKLRSFTKAIQLIVDNIDECSCEKSETKDDFSVLVADAIVKIDNKLDILIGSIAPKHAGEI